VYTQTPNYILQAKLPSQLSPQSRASLLPVT
jgi:hypothetical protein